MDAKSEETHSVRLNYKNYEFEVSIDLDTFRKINTDAQYREDFARQTYESLENNGHFIEEEVDEVKPLFKWTKPAIDQLINIRFNRNDQFKSPKTRKSELWASIAKTLSHTFPGITGEICDAKYRNLLHTYKLNKQKQNKYGLENIKWEYFEQFDNALGLQLTSVPQRDAVFFDSLFAEDLDSCAKDDLLMMDSSPDSPASDDASTSRKKNTSREMKLTQFLRIRAENDIRNMRLKARIWKEKKRLKEREIAAILQLAKALRSKK